MDSDLDVPRFRLEQVAAAAGLDIMTVRNWFSRSRQVVGLSDKDRPAKGRGSPTLLTLRTARSVAITGDLVKLGISPSSAFYSAQFFSRHLRHRLPGGTTREPGRLFPTGLTFLAIWSAPSSQANAERETEPMVTGVLNVHGRADLLTEAFGKSDDEFPTTAVLIHLNRLFDNFDRRLHEAAR